MRYFQATEYSYWDVAKQTCAMTLSLVYILQYIVN